MLVLLSPAKTLNYESALPSAKHSQPRFLDDSQKLINDLKAFSPKRVAKLMGLSEKLAALNVERYRSWEQPFVIDKRARPAIHAFNGDVYLGLDAPTFSARDINFAQKHVRILSGLYGVLRPLDLMQPYRLEMGTALKTQRGKNLYEFWDTRLTDSLNEELEAYRSPLVVNLASIEYFGAIQAEGLKARLISPVFKDLKNGQYKIISFFAKKARGSMARYIVKERVKTARGLLGFDTDGYRFSEAHTSNKSEPVFIRD